MEQKHRIAVGLGANKDDRVVFLKCAFQAICEDLLANAQASDVYESPAWGGVATSPFLNAVVVGETDWKPPAIVNFLKTLEKDLGRTPAPRYADREIDLDLLVYGTETWESDGVVVPHPELEKRAFVLVPLVQVWPDWVHPKTGNSAKKSLENLGNPVLPRFSL